MHKHFIENSPFWAFPSHHKALFKIEEKNKAAIKIQCAWRGYQARQIYKLTRILHKREVAAVVIQKAVRQWLYEKKFRNNYLLSNISEDNLLRLQEDIKRWQENSSDNEKMNFEDLSKEAQFQLNQWYALSPARLMQKKRVEALCTHLEATALILQSSPSLGDVDICDADFYQCASLPLATEARLNHKQQLQALGAPWWKTLGQDTV